MDGRERRGIGRYNKTNRKPPTVQRSKEKDLRLAPRNIPLIQLWGGGWRDGTGNQNLVCVTTEGKEIIMIVAYSFKRSDYSKDSSNYRD